MNKDSNRFIRFQAESYEGYGCIIDNKAYPIKGDIFGSFTLVGKRRLATRMEKSYSLDDIRFLPPCIPQKIICIGLNYAAHVEESTLGEITDEPVLFFKPTSSIIGHLDNIILPNWVDRIDYEGELAVIIGKKLKNVSIDEAEDGIFGYTCLNDVTARNIQKKDKQWTRAKGFDTFCPFGPSIITGIDASSLAIQTRLNGRVVQQSNTNLLLRDTAEVISYISKVMTLFPGDIISTGTPKGVGPLKDGDVVEVKIEQIGILKNFAVAV